LPIAVRSEFEIQLTFTSLWLTPNPRKRLFDEGRNPDFQNTGMRTLWIPAFAGKTAHRTTRTKAESVPISDSGVVRSPLNPN